MDFTLKLSILHTATLVFEQFISKVTPRFNRQLKACDWHARSHLEKKLTIKINIYAAWESKLKGHRSFKSLLLKKSLLLLPQPILRTDGAGSNSDFSNSFAKIGLMAAAGCLSRGLLSEAPQHRLRAPQRPPSSPSLSGTRWQQWCRRRVCSMRSAATWRWGAACTLNFGSGFSRLWRRFLFCLIVQDRTDESAAREDVQCALHKAF